ncbi:MAG: hypothetical protein ACFFAT_09270 [Promethearchaeota archaeon]
MVDFCPECGSLLRKNLCKCGYGQQRPKIAKSTNGIPLIHVWDPPTPNIIYCKITATPLEKLKTGLNKGIVPEKLREIKNKLKKYQITCQNCLYYIKERSHCQIKNKYISKDSICKTFEPFKI